MRRDGGFSLIELLIVVAIILVPARIASAASQLRTLNTAQIAYVTRYRAHGYGALAQLGGAVPCTPAMASACLIDNSLATNHEAKGKSGYNFAIAIINAGQYVASATQ